MCTNCAAKNRYPPPSCGFFQPPPPPSVLWGLSGRGAQGQGQVRRVPLNNSAPFFFGGGGPDHPPTPSDPAPPPPPTPQRAGRKQPDGMSHRGAGGGEMGFCAGPFILCKSGCSRQNTNFGPTKFFPPTPPPHKCVVKMISATRGSFWAVDAPPPPRARQVGHPPPRTPPSSRTRTGGSWEMGFRASPPPPGAIFLSPRTFAGLPGICGLFRETPPDRPASATIPDRRMATPPLPDRGQPQDWRLQQNKNRANSGRAQAFKGFDHSVSPHLKPLDTKLRGTLMCVPPQALGRRRTPTTDTVCPRVRVVHRRPEGGRAASSFGSEMVSHMCTRFEALVMRRRPAAQNCRWFMGFQRLMCAGVGYYWCGGRKSTYLSASSALCQFCAFCHFWGVFLKLLPQCAKMSPHRGGGICMKTWWLNADRRRQQATQAPSETDKTLKHIVSTARRPGVFRIAFFKGFPIVPHIPLPMAHSVDTNEATMAPTPENA